MLGLGKRIILFLRKYTLKCLGIKDQACNLYLSGSEYTHTNIYTNTEKENKAANVTNIWKTEYCNFSLGEMISN